jgi:TPR repeat protein
MRSHGLATLAVLVACGGPTTKKSAEPAALAATGADARDTDGDGAIEDRDRCPGDPEDYDRFEDDDGCPEPDNDADGVLDMTDRCPNDAADACAVATTPPAPAPAPAPAAALPACTDPLGCAHRGDTGRKAGQHAQALADYLRACDLGWIRACSVAGGLLKAGQGAPVDLARAAALYRRGCDGQNTAFDIEACNTLGVMVFSGEGVAADKPAALALFVRACERGNSKACGNITKLGETLPLAALPGDQVVARCNQGDAAACVRAGADAFDTDAKAAERLYKHACDKGNLEGCTYQGVLRFNRGDQRGGRGQWEKACTGGFADACGKLAAMYADGNSVKQDAVRALDFASKACDLEDSDACNLAGNLLIFKDGPRAMSRFQRACTLGDPAGCGLAAHFYRVKELAGVDQDPARALEWEMKGCLLKGAGNCELVARTHAEGWVGAPDPVIAKQYYQITCDLAPTAADACARAR